MPVEKSELSQTELAKYYVANLFLKGVIGTMRLLPYERRIATMGAIVRGLAPVVGFRRRVRRNLNLTCPNLSPLGCSESLLLISKGPARKNPPRRFWMPCAIT